MIVSLYHLKKIKSPSYKYKNTFEEKYLPQLVFKACELISDFYPHVLHFQGILICLLYIHYTVYTLFHYT